MATLTQPTVTSPTGADTRTLVISWSGLLSLVYSRRVMRQDLRNALFYFGCTRGHVFDNGVGGELGEMQSQFRRDPEGVKEIYRMLCVIIRKAEAEGRIAWREPGIPASFGQLNEFLEGHGLPAIEQVNRLDGYGYQTVNEAVREHNLPYRVLSHGHCSN